MRAFVANAVLVPRQLVVDFADGKLNPQQFGEAVARALEIDLSDGPSNPIQQDPGPSNRPSNSSPASLDQHLDFVAWFLAECLERFPSNRQPTSGDVLKLIAEAGDDTTLVRDALDSAEKYSTRARIGSLVGLMLNQIRKEDPDRLRREAAEWRENRDSDETSLTQQAMRQTEAVLKRSDIPSPSMNRIRALQDAIEQRRGASGIATP